MGDRVNLGEDVTNKRKREKKAEKEMKGKKERGKEREKTRKEGGLEGKNRDGLKRGACSNS